MNSEVLHGQGDDDESQNDYAGAGYGPCCCCCGDERYDHFDVILDDCFQRHSGQIPLCTLLGGPVQKVL